MAVYLGNKKISLKSGYTSGGGGGGMKAFFEAGGKCGWSNFTDLTGILQYNDTENVTDLSSMFYNCRYLTTIPLLNTSNATSMVSMFASCNNLLEVPLFDISKVVSTDYGLIGMFAECSALKEIPAFDVSTAKNLDSIFSSCSGLTAIHMTGMKVNFDISASTKFTHAALLEILNNLGSAAGQTLTMGQENLNKLNSGEKRIATRKGWTLA